MKTSWKQHFRCLRIVSHIHKVQTDTVITTTIRSPGASSVPVALTLIGYKNENIVFVKMLTV